MKMSRRKLVRQWQLATRLERDSLWQRHRAAETRSPTAAVYGVPRSRSGPAGDRAGSIFQKAVGVTPGVRIR